jgi:hypothetical protein
MKPLYVAGTQRNVGKTTFCIGLISALQQRGLSVGYTKPLGQRVSDVDGQQLHDDARVITRALALEAESASMAVPLPRGRVEKEIYDLHTPELAEKVAGVCRRLRDKHDVIVVESMGHVAMGSCLKLSAAEVIRLLDARALLISGGGIGRAIDDISLCATFLTSRGANLAGVVVNKIWPEKYRRVREATAKGLENLGIRSFGAIPYEEALSSPTFGQVAEELHGEILSGRESLSGRVAGTIVAAMESEHMVSYLKDRVLVITPGDRSDNILAILSIYVLGRGPNPPVSGMILTGGFRPAGKVMSMMAESGLPAMLCQEDTYTIASGLREMVFKITPDDEVRIGAAKCLVNEYVDVDGILDGLRE